jgi:diguanylate cyclase (GGDEF)-like protein
MGGEEFLVVLPDTTLDEGVAVGERIRAAIEAGADVTVSIGVAASADTEFESLFRAADRALYDAKRGGRNRVVAEAHALAV